MLRQEIINLIAKTIKDLQKSKKLSKFDVEKIQVGHPDDSVHGDYATNIAMAISRIEKKNPMDIAESLKSQLLALSPSFFEKIEAAKPGFVNFFISKEYLQSQIREILKQDKKFGQIKIGRQKKVQVEFISANPTGPLTVGNARGGPFGDVLGNILSKAGFKVKKAYYVNNHGSQILTLGHSVLKDEKAQYKGDYIDYLNKSIKEKDPYLAGKKAAKIIIETMIKKTVAKMGINYHEWSFESDFHNSGAVDRALELLKRKKLIYKKEGALWFKSLQFGDNRDRVMVKKDGLKTYLAGDAALHQSKFESFDKVINVWGADHYGDVAGLQAVVTALGHKGKLDIILLQFVTLLEKNEKLKMSKRLGIYVTMDELLKEITPDVVRFIFLQKSADTHLNFDLSLAKEQSEKNPVYYVQYAFARICSILKKYEEGKDGTNKKVSSVIQTSFYKFLLHPSELELIKTFMRFPEIVEDTANDYQVQRLPQYALDLATAFHRFYRDCRVISDSEELTQARLSLVSCSKIVMKNTLDLMGISAPEKMYEKLKK
ncbi:MAG: arginine--tRNA ligase [bacterium]|nr:arginine--tRNA ligase [bacterium]